MITLIGHCHMDKNCEQPVTHIDNKGYLYCTVHGVIRSKSGRRFGVRCRKLTQKELKRLEQDGWVSPELTNRETR